MFLTTTDLLPVSSLHRDRGDVLPPEGGCNLHHRHGLEIIRRDDSAEELKSGFIRQFRGSGGVAYLWNLEREGGKRETIM